MIDLFSNPLILLLAATLVITSLLFLFVGKKKKPKKIEKLAAKKQAEAKDEKVQKVEENIKKTEENSKNSENFSEEVKGFDKNEEIEINKNKKRVTKVYIRKPKENNVNNDDLIDKETQKYQDLSNRAEFVKTTKQISKLKGFSNQALNEHQEELAEQIREDIENCDTCEEIKSRINHSKRLSESVKNDNFDDLFIGHITEHYLKIDAERHLSNNIEDKMFERTNELLINGQSRALSPEAQIDYNNIKNDKDKLRVWLEENKSKYAQVYDSEEIDNEELKNKLKQDDISLRNLMLADLILKRINKKRK